MHCRTCGYALWNLTKPYCPECGVAFDLRTYRFHPGSVAFACPHCEALHAGTGEGYVPAEAAEAVCQGCGQTMRVVEMRVVPLVDDPPAALASRLPWEERDRLGFWAAWWRTVKMAMVAPQSLIREASPRSTYGESYLFAMWCNLIPYLIQACTLGVVFGGLMVLTAGSQSGVGVGMLELVVLLSMVVVAPFVIPLMLIVTIAAPAQLFLMLFEPDRKGFSVTARCVNYGQGPMVLIGIPVLGWCLIYVPQVWATVATILMIKAAHGTSGLKATLAVLWLPVLYMAAVIGIAVSV